MRIKKNITVGLILLVGTTFFVSPLAAHAATQTFKSTATSSIDSLDGAKYKTLSSVEAIQATTEGLYSYGKGNKIIAGMVKGTPKVSQDKTVYTYKLKDAKWSNGAEVTADDFVYGWQRLANPANNVLRVDTIKNGAEIRRGEKPTSELGVKALDDHTLQVTLAEPTSDLNEILAGAPFVPVNREFADKVGNKYGTSSENVLSNGAFKIKGYSGDDDSWEYVKNDKYWDAKDVTLKKATVQVIKEPSTAANLFDSKKIDYSVLTDTNIKRYEGKKVLHKITTPTVGYLSFNNSKGAFKNVHLRKAFALAINKTVFANKVLNDGSKALNGFVPANFVKTTKGSDYRNSTGQLMKYNLKQAKRELKLAKKDLGKNKINIELLASDTTQSKETTEYIQGQVKKNLPGVKVTLKSVPLTQRISLQKNGDDDVTFGTWTPDYADAANFLEQFVSNNDNFAKYSSKDYDKYVNRATSTYANNPVKRLSELQKAEKLLISKDAAIAPIYQAGISYVKQNDVSGLQLFPYGAVVNYKYIQIK